MEASEAIHNGRFSKDLKCSGINITVPEGVKDSKQKKAIHLNIPAKGAWYIKPQEDKVRLKQAKEGIRY